MTSTVGTGNGRMEIRVLSAADIRRALTAREAVDAMTGFAAAGTSRRPGGGRGCSSQ